MNFLLAHASKIFVLTAPFLAFTTTTLAFVSILPKTRFDVGGSRSGGCSIQQQLPHQSRRNSKERTRHNVVMSGSIPAASNALVPELVLSVRDYLQFIGNIEGDQNVDKLTGGVKSKIRLVLASQSPRRKEILDMMGLKNLYEVIPSPIDETELQNQLRRQFPDSYNAAMNSIDVVDPVVYARTLAEQKALAVAQEINQSNSVLQSILILGSDTIVVMNDDSYRILEKPTDKNDALQMLRRIQGKSHTVFTGVSVVRLMPNSLKVMENSTNDGGSVSKKMQVVQSFVETATVNICHMSETDICSYVATGEPMDKAGAYGIQGIGGQIVSSIQGDFFTVRTYC
jgi:septum formation protein